MKLEFIENTLKNISPYLMPYWEIDHLCYRTQSLEEYIEKKNDFSKSGKLLIESEIGGRPIATYQLNEPILSSHGVTSLIELPAPKIGKKTESGYEHVEVVIDEDFETLIELYPNLNWDSRAVNKELNPELEAKFEKFNVKFHHHSLDCIIEIEKHSTASAFIPFMQLFKEYKPLISGTIPLGIAVENSDLDILMICDDFDELSKKIKLHFSDALIKIKHNYLIANFTFNHLPIEIYAENVSPLKQIAHQHLRIENRLIKILGNNFKKEIIKHKRDGLKTEAAFGKVLNINDPLEQLLILHNLSDLELIEKFKNIKTRDSNV